MNRSTLTLKLALCIVALSATSYVVSEDLTVDDIAAMDEIELQAAVKKLSASDHTAILKAIESPSLINIKQIKNKVFRTYVEQHKNGTKEDKEILMELRDAILACYSPVGF